MKVIELLNKIANVEELPTKIRIWGRFYYLCENDNSGQCYFTEKEGFGGFPLKFNTSEMNDEVKIIEEDKIEKLYETNCESDECTMLREKINEIIDYINKGDKE